MGREAEGSRWATAVPLGLTRCGCLILIKKRTLIVVSLFFFFPLSLHPSSSVFLSAFPSLSPRVWCQGWRQPITVSSSGAPTRALLLSFKPVAVVTWSGSPWRIVSLTWRIRMGPSSVSRWPKFILSFSFPCNMWPCLLCLSHCHSHTCICISGIPLANSPLVYSQTVCPWIA